MQIIDPETDKKALRAAFGQYATGVTIVTVATPTGPLGMTVNSFTSVSLEPAMLLWCPAKASGRHAPMLAAKQFALHILTCEQEELAHGFSTHGDVFDLCDWQAGAGGLPLIQDCAARFICTTEKRISAGDHSILLARITQAESSANNCLIFSEGQYGGFQS